MLRIKQQLTYETHRLRTEKRLWGNRLPPTQKVPFESPGAPQGTDCVQAAARHPGACVGAPRLSQRRGPAALQPSFAGRPGSSRARTGEQRGQNPLLVFLPEPGPLQPPGRFRGAPLPLPDGCLRPAALRPGHAGPGSLSPHTRLLPSRPSPRGNISVRVKTPPTEGLSHAPSLPRPPQGSSLCRD